MAITVNGAVLRNMPEQISKNVDDIADLQTTSENHEDRIVALENDVILAASFEDTIMTGTTSISDTLNVSASSTFSNGITANSITSTAATVGSLTVSGNETVSGTLGVGGAATLSSTLGVAGNLTASSDISVGDDLTVTSDATIGGDLAVTGAITGGSIIENMSGYSASLNTVADLTIENVYTNAVKNGNKLTIVSALNLTKTATLSGTKNIANITVPTSIANKLQTTTIGLYGCLSLNKINGIDTSGTFHEFNYFIGRSSNVISINMLAATIDNLPLNTKTYIRFEATFLLSDSLI